MATRMGRKPIPNAERRSVPIRCYVTPAEHQHICRAAEGGTLSDFGRIAMLREADSQERTANRKTRPQTQTVPAEEASPLPPAQPAVTTPETEPADEHEVKPEQWLNLSGSEILDYYTTATGQDKVYSKAARRRADDKRDMTAGIVKEAIQENLTHHNPVPVGVLVKRLYEGL